MIDVAVAGHVEFTDVKAIVMADVVPEVVQTVVYIVEEVQVCPIEGVTSRFVAAKTMEIA
jgi:hypothetical protein